MSNEWIRKATNQKDSKVQAKFKAEADSEAKAEWWPHLCWRGGGRCAGVDCGQRILELFKGKRIRKELMEKERRWQIDRCLLLLSAERNSERGESSHLHLHHHLHPKTRQRQRLVEILVPIMTLKRCSFFVIWIFLFAGCWSRWSEERLAINYNRDRGGVEPPELQLNHQSTWNLHPATRIFCWPSAASSNCRCFLFLCFNPVCRLNAIGTLWVMATQRCHMGWRIDRAYVILPKKME